MTFNEWVTLETRKEDSTRTAVFERLSILTGVSVVTLGNVDRGLRLRLYAKARAVSDATDGLVSVEELCE